MAHKYGVVVGGLFLAFPAIYPASAIMIENHEGKKARSGIQGVTRGRKLAGVDGIGAIYGSIGLIAFAILTWRLLNHRKIRSPPNSRYDYKTGIQLISLRKRVSHSEDL